MVKQILGDASRRKIFHRAVGALWRLYECMAGIHRRRHSHWELLAWVSIAGAGGFASLEPKHFVRAVRW